METEPINVSPLSSNPCKVNQLNRRSLRHVVRWGSTTTSCYLTAHTEPNRAGGALGLLVSKYQLSVVYQELEYHTLDLYLRERARVRVTCLWPG